MRSSFTLECSKPRRRKLARAEDDLQARLVTVLRKVLTPATFWFHVPNQGVRTPAQAQILAMLGLRAGVPDLVFIFGGKVLLIECKSSEGTLSSDQRTVHTALRAAGARVEVARTLTQALNILRSFGIPMLDLPPRQIFG